MRRVSVPHRARIWVPSKRDDLVKSIRESLVNATGGVTETLAWGSWVDESTAQVVAEPVVVFEAFYNGGGLPEINRAVADLLEAGEKCVLVEFDGEGALFS